MTPERLAEIRNYVACYGGEMLRDLMAAYDGVVAASSEECCWCRRGAIGCAILPKTGVVWYCSEHTSWAGVDGERVGAGSCDQDAAFQRDLAQHDFLGKSETEDVQP